MTEPLNVPVNPIKETSSTVAQANSRLDQDSSEIESVQKPVQNKDCLVPMSSPFHSIFCKIQAEFDLLDNMIVENHQLGLDLLVSDSDEELEEAAKELERTLLDL